ncbi:MAG: Hsp70 family protein [Chloroflexi bacterium]|nr:Hsp70 family protein [Chloroflexota bacterium]
MEYSLGIDFGTSTTKVALCKKGENPRPLPIGSKGDLFMPSVVCFRKTKSGRAEVMAVGEDAETQTVTDDTVVVREIKRLLIGLDKPPRDPKVLDRYSSWDWTNGRVRLWSSYWSPYSIAMEIIQEAIRRAVNQAHGFGYEVDHYTIKGLPCRIGCPVKSGLEARQGLAEIARRLGFSSFTVANGVYEEPILAALEYVRQTAALNDEMVLVYDFGGGSFDTAIIKVSDSGGNKQAMVMSADGEPYCGGSDIDRLFGEYVAEKIASETGLGSGKAFLAGMSPAQAHLFGNRIREAKEALSFGITTPFSLDFLGRRDRVLTLQRTELEETIRKSDLLARTKQCVLRNFWRVRMFDRNSDESLHSYYRHEKEGRLLDPVYQLTHKDLANYITKVLAVGGMTKTPLVRETLEGLWGKDKFIGTETTEPVEACALGAAGSGTADSLSDRSIMDRLPFSIIVRGKDGDFVAYKAFEPIVRFSGHEIKEYCSQQLPHSRPFKVILKYPDGTEKEHRQINGGVPPFYLKFDIYGSVFLKDYVQERPLECGCQSAKQRQMYAWKLARDQKNAEAERKAMENYFRQGPYEEHQTG